MKFLEKPAVAFGAAVFVFLAAVAASRLAVFFLGAAFIAEHAWLPHAVLKTALLLLSLGAIAVQGGSAFAESGFRKAQDVPWAKVVLFGLVLGAAATVAIVVTPAQGMKAQMEAMGGLPGVVLWVWLYSSLSEEVFTRGWFQGLLRKHREKVVRPLGVTISVPVGLSALLFGAMHLSLLFSADLWTVGIIVCMTTLLGLVAARFREHTGGLLPAFVTHLSFNVGGFLGGIGVAIFWKVVFGTLPPL